MTPTTYIIHDFDYNKALGGALCIIVLNTYTPDPPTVPPTITDTDTTNFKGAGIVRKDNPNRLMMTVEGVSHYFKDDGTCIDLNGYSLKLATIAAPTREGSLITDINIGSVTRAGSENNSVVLDNLNPRDEFAIQALNSMMAKIQDPSVLGDAEMDLYCKAAYLWASNMMKNAAIARATLNDTIAPETSAATISSLDNNTERLLNNLIVELSGNDKPSDGGTWSKTVGETVTSAPGEHTDAWVSTHTLGGTTYLTVAAAEADGWSWKADYYSDRQENTIVGFQNLIDATNLSTLNKTVDTTQGSEKLKVGGSIDIGASGLGRDSSHPVYISGGGGGSSTDVVHIGSSTNGRGESSSYPFVVKGGDTYTPSGGTAINDVVKVAIVAGGGSSTIDKSSVPTVQPSLTYTLEHVLVFQYDTYSTSLRKVALGDLGVPVLQTISNGNFPSYSDIKKGYYYKFITTNPTVVDIDLPAAAVPNGDIVNIVIFSFTLSATANFSVTAQNNNDIWYRESNPGATLAAGTYEIDCLADGNRWIIGVTKLVQ